MSMLQHRPRAIGTTFRGFVFDTPDALLLFEAVFRRQIPYIPRRLVPGEYRDLVKSGSIFIYEEYGSGIKRWTDGRAWSPSRVLDNFLVYRESEKVTPTVEKKKMLKRKLSNSFDEMPADRKKRRDSVALESPEIGVDEKQAARSPEPAPRKKRSASPEERELIKSLAGSFTDDSVCRDNGLIKKTMSIVINGLVFHMVSYYTIEDIKNNVLIRPSRDQRLRNLSIRPELYRQNFRQAVYMPVDERPTASPTTSTAATTGNQEAKDSKANSGLYLTMAPGTHRIQLQQTPTSHQTRTRESTPSQRTAGGTTATPLPYQPQAQYYHHSHPKQNQQYVPRAFTMDEHAVQSPRPPLEWHTGWQPRGYYSPSMPPPHPGFLWADAAASESTNASATTATFAMPSTVAHTQTDSSLPGDSQAMAMMMMPAGAMGRQAFSNRTLLPAPDGGMMAGRGGYVVS